MERQAVNRVLVIGIGNEFRRDDAVGLVVARRLAELRLSGVSVRQQSGDGVALMESWRGAEAVILVDAARSGREPGTIQRLEVNEIGESGQSGGVSSHGFGIGGAIEMARVLGRLPPRLIVYGVEAGSFDFGKEMSPAVARAVGETVERVLEDVKCMSMAWQGR